MYLGAQELVAWNYTIPCFFKYLFTYLFSIKISSTLQNFEILIVAFVTQFLLEYIRLLSIALQAVAGDLMKVHIQVRPLVDTIGDIRKKVMKIVPCLFERASSMAAENEITVTKLRTSGRQRHAANAYIRTTKTYSKRSNRNQ